MSDLQTFIALVKGYCSIFILFLPRAFVMGGYLVSPLLMACSAMLTSLCVVKLVRVGQSTETFCYSKVAEIVFGRKFRRVLDGMILLTQFTFAISALAFMTGSMQIVFWQAFGLRVELVFFGLFLALFMIPVSWVRNFAQFSFTFLLGNVLLVLILVLVSIIASD